MRGKSLQLVGSVGAIVLCLAGANAWATAVATADIQLDWNSLSTTFGPGLTWAPQGGRFANTAYLGVAQAEVHGVPVPGTDLQAYNQSNLPVTTLVSQQYSAGDGTSSVSANLATGPVSGKLLAVASDSDGNMFNGNYVNAYVGRSMRFLVSGTGNLDVSVDFTMDLGTAGQAGQDFADVYATIALTLQDYTPLAGGGYDAQTYQDRADKHVFSSQGDPTFLQSGTLHLSLPFSGAADHLVLIEANAYGIPFANSFAGGGSQVPEPGVLALTALGLIAVVARCRKA